MPQSQLGRYCEVCQRKHNGEFMQKEQIHIILFFLASIELLEHYGANLHDRAYNELFQIFFGFWWGDFSFILFCADDFSQTGTSLGLLFRVKGFENI